MKSYSIETEEGVKNILADEFEGYLVWPGTQIPFFDKGKLSKHNDKKFIETTVKMAEDGDAGAIEKLWCKEYISICYKV
jgi:hypothetical protein